jgi:hypothetical protein
MGMPIKKCSMCKVGKPINEFCKRKGTKDGLSYICKDCKRITTRNYKKTEKGKLTEKRYRQGEKGKNTYKKINKRYFSTENGRNKIYARNKKYRDELRLEILIHYSGGIPKCKKCGEIHIEFLEIDHIKGGGRKQSIATKGYNLYKRLKKENYPEGYQVLCSNCNWKKFKTFKRSQFINVTKNQVKTKKYNNKLRNEVFSHYMTGGKIKCSCPGCIVDDIDVLCIDHINGNGANHRKEIKMKGGSEFYRWIRKNGYPDDLRLLCCNCNQALNNYGYCPHEREVENDIH